VEENASLEASQGFLDEGLPHALIEVHEWALLFAPSSF